MPVTTMAAAPATARGLRSRRRGALGEWGGLALPGTPGHVQGLRQALELVTQPVPLALQPGILFAQALGVPFDTRAVSLHLIPVSLCLIAVALRLITVSLQLIALAT